MSELYLDYRRISFMSRQKKCEFHLKQTTFLGYHISHEGVKIDETRVKAVT